MISAACFCKNSYRDWISWILTEKRHQKNPHLRTDCDEVSESQHLWTGNSWTPKLRINYIKQTMNGLFWTPALTDKYFLIIVGMSAETHLFFSYNTSKPMSVRSGGVFVLILTTTVHPIQYSTFWAAHTATFHFHFQHRESQICVFVCVCVCVCVCDVL